MSYVVAGDRVFDSADILNQINAYYPFKMVKDLTKGSKREDTLVYQIIQNVRELKEEFLVEHQEPIEAEDLASELMELADEKLGLLHAVMPSAFLIYTYSYYYDSQLEEIKGILVALDRQAGEPKLKDVVERILRSID